jgi:uncharacterized protein (DUF2141 family)
LAINNPFIAQSSRALLKDTAMKKFAIAFGALAVVLLIAFDTQAQSAAPAAACPTLEVTGLKPGEGVLMVAVYASADTFFKKPAWTNGQKVVGATMQVPICNLNAEEIAVMAFVDMNGNEKLDSNPLGIPTEPYAASGKPPMFSAPSWNDVKVSFKNATAMIPVKF